MNTGVKQIEAEELIRKHGPTALAAALDELDTRLKMPSDKVGAVIKPGSWLRAHMARVVKQAAELPAPAAPGVSPESLQKHRAAWTDEWLRRRKDRLRDGFQELGEAEQHDLIESFRQELKETSQVQLLRRLNAAGWQHRMVLSAFIKFYALRTIGQDWDKPTSDDILAIAAELAMVLQARPQSPTTR